MRFLLLLSIIITSCVSPIRTTTYFDEITAEYIDRSEPLELEIEDDGGSKSSVILILERNRSKEQYFMILRWRIGSKYRPDIASTDSLKFMINEDDWRCFSPISTRIFGINISPSSIEEEAVYNVPLEMLETCLTANKIKIFLSGRRFALRADLSSKHHKLAFKNFLMHIK